MQIEWLDGLESRVHDAIERLGEQREENRTLRDTINGLETRLAAASAPTAAPPPWEELDRDEEIAVLRARVQELERQLAAAETERAEAAAAASAWEIEREEVRRRVEGLTARLEGLVGA